MSDTSRNSKICCVTVLKHEFDVKLKLKVDGVYMLVTVTSLQMPKLNAIPADNLEFDAQLICDVKCNLKNHKLFSFPWRPGNPLCWFYIFTIIDIMVLLLTSVVCALFANTVKAKATKKCSAGYPCYSVFHTLVLEAEEYEKELSAVNPWSGI